MARNTVGTLPQSIGGLVANRSRTNGAIRYTYDGANHLNKIETHDGSGYSTLAQMAYDGIGSRAVLTGWISGVAYTTTYASRIAGKVRILQAKSGVNATSHLYGLNQIGEFGSQSVYYLTDGVGSIRHLVDPNGAVKLARLYEPLGQVLMQAGTGDPMHGYLVIGLVVVLIKLVLRQAH